ncbi:ABC transporter substrate-binding protein [Nocardia sp. NPDC059177]|uniref:ABC transporter substrate-binding protein n=1 Tax=Nocardia sp. NPDC059177 TaxID=3346759 RepID=UPI0036A2D707
MPDHRPPSGEMSRRRMLGGTLAAAALPFLAGACGGTGSAGTGAELTVTDLTGRVVELSGPARRVVTIPMPAASMMVAVNGGPDVLAGMNAASATAIESGFLGEVYPRLLDVRTDVAGAEFAPNVESILAAEPDVVIQWGDRGPGITEPLRAAGLTVAELSYGTQADLEGAVRMYGELLGKRERASRIVDGMRTTLDRMRAAAPADPACSVLYLFGGAEAMHAAGAGSYNHFVIELAGARNCAAGIGQQRATIGTEQLLAWDPDVVLLGNFGPAQPDDLYGDPALATLRAVRERRVYKVPLGGYRWDPPSQESPLMWQWLAGLVHGTRAPGLRAEIVRQYGFLYGVEPTAAQLDAMLAMPSNGGSRDYADFGR